jgi:two-component system, LytTR family, response regulator
MRQIFRALLFLCVIVNVERIGEMHPLDNGEYRLLLSDGTELKLSRTHRRALQDLLRAHS